jgi:hypothetical protein
LEGRIECSDQNLGKGPIRLPAKALLSVCCSLFQSDLQSSNSSRAETGPYRLNLGIGMKGYLGLSVMQGFQNEMSKSESGNPMRSRRNEAMEQKKPSDLLRSFRLSHFPCGQTEFTDRLQTVVPDLEYHETFPKVILVSILRKATNQTTNPIQFHSLDCVNRNQALKSRHCSSPLITKKSPNSRTNFPFDFECQDFLRPEN